MLLALATWRTVCLLFEITITNVYLHGACASLYLMLTLLLWVKYYTARMAERCKALVKTTLCEAVGSRPTHGSILYRYSREAKMLDS